MKKLLSIAFLAIVVMAFASCKKTYVTNVPNEVYNVPIPASSWKLSEDGTSYFVTIEANAIGDIFNRDGAVLVYFSFFPGVYEQIPEVYNGNSFSYTHEVKLVTLYAQSPVAGQPPVKPTDNINVKMVLIPAN
jgi:hypothetical protein